MSRLKSLAAALANGAGQILAPVKEACSLWRRMLDRLCAAISPFETEAMSISLSAMLSFSVSYCLISAHGITVSGIWMLLGCILISAAASAFFLALDILGQKEEYRHIRFGTAVGVPAAAMLLCWLLRRSIADSARTALPVIAHNYGIDMEIGQNELFLPETSTLFMLVIALLPALTSVCAVSCARSWILAAAGSVPVFAVSMMRFSQLPAGWAVCMYVFALGMIMMTDRLRRRSDAAALRHTVRIMPVLATFILALGLFVDPSDYKTPDWLDNLQQRTYAAVGELMRSNENHFSSQTSSSINDDRVIELDELTSQQNLGIKVMTVRMGSSKPCYLRALSYAGYENNEWRVLGDFSAEQINRAVASPLTEQLNSHSPTDSIIIRTETAHTFIYTPYYAGISPEGSRPVGDSCIRNTALHTVYHISQGSTPSLSTFISGEEDAVAAAMYRELVESIYLDISDSTAASLLELAVQEGIISAEDYWLGAVPVDDVQYAQSVVQRAAQFVQNCTVYTLDPPPVPEGADFPVWFLTQADGGYCTHFASSGAVLLRALGIPARLTVGYYVAPSSEEWRVVTSDDAHAWVEYYLPTLGWQMLEVTGRYADDTSFDEDAAGGTTTQSTTATTTTTSAATSVAPTTTTAAPPASGSDSGSAAEPEHSGSQPDVSPSDSGGSLSSEGEKNSRPGSFVRFLAVLLCIVLAAAAVYGSLMLAHWIIMSRRRAQCTEGSTNQRVIAMWDNVLRLSAVLNEEPPEQLEALMLKARFSQHVISDSELRIMGGYLKNQVRRLDADADRMTRFVRRYVMFCY